MKWNKETRTDNYFHPTTCHKWIIHAVIQGLLISQGPKHSHHDEMNSSAWRDAHVWSQLVASARDAFEPRTITGSKLFFYLSWLHSTGFLLGVFWGSRDDQFENLRKTYVLTCEMSTSGFLLWLKSVACLSSLIKHKARAKKMGLVSFPPLLQWLFNSLLVFAARIAFQVRTSVIRPCKWFTGVTFSEQLLKKSRAKPFISFQSSQSG